MLTGFQEDGMVCLLLQALYGLKQARSLQYAYFNAILEELGFTLIDNDLYMFLRSITQLHESIPTTSYLLIYIDDILNLNTSELAQDKLLEDIQTKLKVKDLSKPTKFLGYNL